MVDGLDVGTTTGEWTQTCTGTNEGLSGTATILPPQQSSQSLMSLLLSHTPTAQELRLSELPSELAAQSPTLLPR